MEAQICLLNENLAWLRLFCPYQIKILRQKFDFSFHSARKKNLTKTSFSHLLFLTVKNGHQDFRNNNINQKELISNSLLYMAFFSAHCKKLSDIATLTSLEYMLQIDALAVQSVTGRDNRLRPASARVRSVLRRTFQELLRVTSHMRDHISNSAAAVAHSQTTDLFPAAALNNFLLDKRKCPHRNYSILRETRRKCSDTPSLLFHACSLFLLLHKFTPISSYALIRSLPFPPALCPACTGATRGVIRGST